MMAGSSFLQCSAAHLGACTHNFGCGGHLGQQAAQHLRLGSCGCTGALQPRHSPPADVSQRQARLNGALTICFSGRLSDSGENAAPWVKMLRNSSAVGKNSEIPWMKGVPLAGAKPASEWTEERRDALQAYWVSRGVSSKAALEQHVALAKKHPLHRDLEYVRGRMAEWDAIVDQLPLLVNVNRIVRANAEALGQSPQQWLAKVQQMVAAYPEVCWQRVLEEYPSLAFMSHLQMAEALNKWVAAMPDAPVPW